MNIIVCLMPLILAVLYFILWQVLFKYGHLDFLPFTSKFSTHIPTRLKSTNQARLLCFCVGVLVIEEIVYIVLYVLLSNFIPATSDSVPLYMWIFIALVPYVCHGICTICRNFSHVCLLAKRIATAAIILFLCEIVLFNAKSWTTNTKVWIMTSDVITFEDTDAVTQEGQALIITDDTTIYLHDLEDFADVGGVVLKMQQDREDANTRFLVELAMEDDDFQDSYQTVGQQYTMAYSTDCSFSISPYGELHDLKLTFSSVSSPITLYSIQLSGAVPFAFSILRYGVLLAAVSLLLWIIEYKIYRITFQPDKISHWILPRLLALCCIVPCLGIACYSTSDKLYLYEDGEDYTSYDPYVQLFDAFYHGRVSLDLEVDPELEALENPYDNSARDGVSYSWDYAYYDGEYYVYFGAAPVLILYYPMYFLTGCVPSLLTTNVIFTICAILFFEEALLALVQLMHRRCNLLLLCGSIPASVCAIGFYWCVTYADKYYVAYAAGLCFLFLSLWLGLRAMRASKSVTRNLLLVGSGLSLALCVSSRPMLALSAVLLLPFFFGFLRRKSVPSTSKIAAVACFALPLLAGVSVQLWYNYVRFDSIFEFGATYQLTVNDIHANTIRLSAFIPAIANYFFAFPKTRSTFPYFTTSSFSSASYGQYVYMSAFLGILSFPMILCGSLLLPIAWRRKHKNGTRSLRTSGGRGYVYDTTRFQRNAVLLLCFVIPICIAWFDFCMAGTNHRYIVDTMPLIALGSTLTILYSTDQPTRHRYRYILAGVSMAATCLYVVLYLVSISGYNLTYAFPNLYDIMEDLFIFWR